MQVTSPLTLLTLILVRHGWVMGSAHPVNVLNDYVVFFENLAMGLAPTIEENIKIKIDVTVFVLCTFV